MFDTNQEDVALEKRSLETIKVPATLQSPAMPNQFDIPQSEHANAEIEIRSPALVLATAASSRLDEGERLARVWFDRNDLTGDLLPFLQNTLQLQFQEQGVELIKADSSGLEFTTGWISRSQSSGFWLWKSSEIKEQARFKLQYEPRPHGRSISLTVTMVDHEYFDESFKLKGAAARRQEVNLLNQIIDRVTKEEVAVARANKTKTVDVSIEAGFDSEGNAALISDQSIDIVWSQLEKVFAELNLTANDVDRSKYTYFLTYKEPTKGFWGSLWGSQAPVILPIAEAEYQLVLKRSAEKTALLLLDANGAPLKAELVQALYDPFVEAIRRAKVEL